MSYAPKTDDRFTAAYEKMLSDRAEKIAKDIEARGVGRVLAEILTDPHLYKMRP